MKDLTASSLTDTWEQRSAERSIVCVALITFESSMRTDLTRRENAERDYGYATLTALKHTRGISVVFTRSCIQTPPAILGVAQCLNARTRVVNDPDISLSLSITSLLLRSRLLRRRTHAFLSRMHRVHQLSYDYVSRWRECKRRTKRDREREREKEKRREKSRGSKRLNESCLLLVQIVT